MATTTKKQTISEEISYPTHPVDYKKIEENHLMLAPYWIKVNKKQLTEVIQVTDIDNQMPFEIRGKDLIERCFSADQYEVEKTLSQTKLVELFMTCYNVPFTVVFTKKEGEVRTLRGRLMSTEPMFGRSHCEDLDITDGYKLRLVDHRTISSLIVKGTKYIVK